mmetsp:Transcript_9855/g.25926  ORF Transcript_9855/g.25926 Transcript_9855/m.25926 type:complete len:371 (+) Transcript_9855:89-1201(+)|eukprot:CAMPEP_0117472912 /NCGR_PEP_ID=MMETSP0784-20121206/8495_1 /TAXON_ID=39447 /ORGANISM="" /LENGTH=370 /DNA_ID=CAMNT_0005267085 /DNA_START=78 /DNA_END=1190 /DNA_ORIENTATION=+
MAGSVKWTATTNSYCSKSGGSIAIVDYASMGFGLTSQACRALCLENSACNVYTFGVWKVGLSPRFGGHYGETRCQLYSSCAQREHAGMTLFVKELPPSAWINAFALVVTMACLAVAAAAFTRRCQTMTRVSAEEAISETGEQLEAPPARTQPKEATTEKSAAKAKVKHSRTLSGRIVMDLTDASSALSSPQRPFEGPPPTETVLPAAPSPYADSWLAPPSDLRHSPLMDLQLQAGSDKSELPLTTVPIRSCGSEWRPPTDTVANVPTDTVVHGSDLRPPMETMPSDILFSCTEQSDMFGSVVSDGMGSRKGAEETLCTETRPISSMHSDASAGSHPPLPTGVAEISPGHGTSMPPSSAHLFSVDLSAVNQ